MAVLRISKKRQNFVILDKTCLFEPKLSLGAKGLHAYLMCMPDNWEVQVANLQKSSTNGRDAVRGFLSELEKFGYIKKSLNRDQETGKFGGYDYLVLETPDITEISIPPKTENPSTVDLTDRSPATEKPFTGNPAPVNPPLISNKYNNKLINKTAAKEDQKLLDSVETISTAAAVKKFNVVKNNNIVSLASFQGQSRQDVSYADATIGQLLTTYQEQAISKTIENLSFAFEASDPDELFEEIAHALLDHNQFKGCGKDFHHKLNSIRLVIQRGDWRRPRGMKRNDEHSTETKLSELSMKLSQAQADLRHFKGLQMISQGELRQQYDPYRAKVLDIFYRSWMNAQTARSESCMPILKQSSIRCFLPHFSIKLPILNRNWMCSLLKCVRTMNCCSGSSQRANNS